MYCCLFFFDYNNTFQLINAPHLWSRLSELLCFGWFCCKQSQSFRPVLYLSINRKLRFCSIHWLQSLFCANWCEGVSSLQRSSLCEPDKVHKKWWHHPGGSCRLLCCWKNPNQFFFCVISNFEPAAHNLDPWLLSVTVAAWLYSKRGYKAHLARWRPLHPAYLTELTHLYALICPLFSAHRVLLQESLAHQGPMETL